MKIFNLQYLEKYAWGDERTLRHGGTSHEHRLQQRGNAISINKEVDILSPHEIDQRDFSD
jgi:hypothetical protein